VWNSVEVFEKLCIGERKAKGMASTGNFTGDSIGNSTGCTYCNLPVTQSGLCRHVNTAHRNTSTGELNALEGFSKWRECDYYSSRFVEDRVLATHIRVALQILPGLVEYCHHQRRKVLTPIELLRSIEVIPDKAIEIIRIAREWLPSRRALPKTWPKPNVEHTRARIEALASENRLSSATAALITLQNLLTGVPAVPVPSAEFISQRIRELHPESGERDILPDSMEDLLNAFS
jgi:hypothetical protein